MRYYTTCPSTLSICWLEIDYFMIHIIVHMKSPRSQNDLQALGLCQGLHLLDYLAPSPNRAVRGRVEIFFFNIPAAAVPIEKNTTRP